MCQTCNETFVVFDTRNGIIEVKVSEAEGKKLVKYLDGEILLIPLSEYDPEVNYFKE